MMNPAAGRRGLLVVPAVALIFAAFGIIALSACASPPNVATVEVKRSAFRHRVTAEGNLRAKDKTKISVPPTVRRRVRLAWIAREGSLLEKGDLVARFDGKGFEQSLGEARADLAGTNLDVVRTQAESDLKVGEYARDLGVADLELGFARRYKARDRLIFSLNEIVEGALDERLASAKRGHAESMTGIQESLARTELEILGIREGKANLEIAEAQAGLDSLEVRAPHRGILTLVRNWRGASPSVGGEMWRGQEIGEIPALDTMEAEVFVLEADAGGLAEGKSATVVVEAHPETSHQATVSRVDALAKPRFLGSPVQYFGVVLSLASVDPKVMKPGQRVVARLLLEGLDEAIVVPRQAVFQEGEERLVYRRRGRAFEPRTVAVGASSAGLMVIVSGLDEGDVIALSRPADEDLVVAPAQADSG